MHKSRGAWISVGIAAIICLGIAVLGRYTLDRTVPRQVKTVTLTPQTLTNSILCQGRLEYGLEYTVSADLPLRIASLSVSPGDMVSPGDTLLIAETLDSSFQTEEIDLRTELQEAFSQIVGSDSSSGTAVSCVVRMKEQKTQALYSPCGGIITEINVEENTQAAAETVLLTVAAPQSIRMKAALPENYVQDVQEGMAVTITGDAFRAHSYEGTIEQIMPCAYQNTTLTDIGDTVVDILISLNAPDDALKAGYSAKASILCERNEQALLVPYEAIHQDNDGEYVMVLENGVAVRKSVETGLELSEQAEISDGLQCGDIVILEEVAEGEAVCTLTAEAESTEEAVDALD